MRDRRGERKQFIQKYSLLHEQGGELRGRHSLFHWLQAWPVHPTLLHAKSTACRRTRWQALPQQGGVYFLRRRRAALQPSSAP